MPAAMVPQGALTAPHADVAVAVADTNTPLVVSTA
jgi:hypothetical protein